MIEEVADPDQRAVAVAQEEDRPALRLFPHLGEEVGQVLQVLVERVDVCALPVAVSVTAAVERMHGVPAGRERPRDLHVAPKMLCIAMQDDDVGDQRTVRRRRAAEKAQAVARAEVAVFG